MRVWWPLVAVCIGTFLLLVDLTIVNVALPSMAVSLSSSFAGLQWVVDGYALALASLLMVTGSLADWFGRRRVYLAGLGVFAVASLVCGSAPNAGVLITGRVLQGAGAAAMFTTTAALLSTTYQGRRRGVAFGVWGAVNGFAAASGPLLGGLLIEAWSWRAIVLVNLPLAALAIGLTLRVVGADTATERSRVDAAGAASFTVAATSLVYGLIEAGSQGWASTSSLVGLVVASGALVVFVLIERHVQDPMLDLALLGDPSFSTLMLAAAVLSAAAFAHLVLVSLWLQTVLGLSAIRAGLAVIPLSLASFLVSVTVGRYLHRGSPAIPIAAGLVLCGTGLLLLSAAGPASGPEVLLPGLVVDGLGVGLATSVLVSATLAVLPPSRAGIGSAAVNTFRQLGAAIGLAVLAAIFTSRVTAVLAGAGQASRAAALTSGRADLLDPALARQAAAAGLDTVFTTAGLAALITAGLVAVLVRGPGAADPLQRSPRSPMRAGATSAGPHPLGAP